MSSDLPTLASFVNDFTEEYRIKMENAVEKYFTDEYFDSLGGPLAMMQKQFASQAWREFYIGCLPPARQMTQIYEIGDPYDRDRDLIVGLGEQIRDEVKHAKIYANLSEQVGVPCDLATWTADNYDRLVAKCRLATEWEKPQYIAAGFQVSTEIVAAETSRRMGEYVENDYPEIAKTPFDVTSDEGDHIHCGRLIVKRFATEDDFDFMHEIAEKKYNAALRILESL